MHVFTSVRQSTGYNGSGCFLVKGSSFYSGCRISRKYATFVLSVPRLRLENGKEWAEFIRYLSILWPESWSRVTDEDSVWGWTGKSLAVLKRKSFLLLVVRVGIPESYFTWGDWRNGSRKFDGEGIEGRSRGRGTKTRLEHYQYPQRAWR